MSIPDPRLTDAIEGSRRRLWAICYRMTGRAADADDLCQEAIARAIERAAQLTREDPTGWLIRIATTTCLDHARSARRRMTELVDPIELDAQPALAPDPEHAAILRDDVRYAVVTALQHLTPRQRAALILHDVCERPVAEVAEVVGCNANAAKALIHRARVALAAARHRTDVDVPVDPRVVEALARAIEAGALDRLEALLAEDAWGVVDGGGAGGVPAAKRPSVGRRSVVRRFANAWRRLGGIPLRAEVRLLNGEHAVIVRAGPIVTAVIHVESRGGAIAALRIDRDPRRTRALGSRVLGR